MQLYVFGRTKHSAPLWENFSITGKQWLPVFEKHAKPLIFQNCTYLKIFLNYSQLSTLNSQLSTFNKSFHDFQCFCFGSVEVVVDDDAVELGREGELILGLVDALLDDLGGVGATAFKSAAELLY